MFALLLGLLTLVSVAAVWGAAHRTLDFHRVGAEWPFHLIFCTMVAGVTWFAFLAGKGLAPEIFGDDDIWWFILLTPVGVIGLLGSLVTNRVLSRPATQRNSDRSPFLGLQLAWWAAHFLIFQGPYLR